MATTAEEIQKLLERLPQHDQERILSYAHLCLQSHSPIHRCHLVHQALLSLG